MFPLGKCAMPWNIKVSYRYLRIPCLRYTTIGRPWPKLINLCTNVALITQHSLHFCRLERNVISCMANRIKTTSKYQVKVWYFKQITTLAITSVLWHEGRSVHKSIHVGHVRVSEHIRWAVHNVTMYFMSALPLTSCQIRKSAGCACAGNTGNVFPPPQFRYPDMHHGMCVTHVPWCMPGSLNCIFIWNWRRGKRSRHSRRMRNPQVYASGRGPIAAIKCIMNV